MAELQYLTVPQLKRAIGGDQFNIDDDLLLAQAISAASRQIDEFRGDQFWREDAPTERTFIPDNYGTLWTGDFATTEGLTVEEWNGATWTPWLDSDWQAGPLRRRGGRPYTHLTAVGSRRFPFRRICGGTARKASVRVFACWGWPEVPAEVVQACQILAIDAWKSKDLTGGVAGFGDLGAIRIAAFNPQAKALLQPFELFVMA